MEQMREAVARALCELHIRTVRRHDTPPDELEAMLPGSVDYAWRDFIPQADAAIATMFERLRPPSEGMTRVGWQAVYDTSGDTRPEEVWQAMLAAFQQENSDA